MLEGQYQHAQKIKALNRANHEPIQILAAIERVLKKQDKAMDREWGKGVTLILLTTLLCLIFGVVAAK